jgi:hypothetical protein
MRLTVPNLMELHSILLMLDRFIGSGMLSIDYARAGKAPH